jgi:hypothetical protein
MKNQWGNRGGLSMLQTLPCDISPDKSKYYQKNDYYLLKGIRIKDQFFIKASKKPINQRFILNKII